MEIIELRKNFECEWNIDGDPGGWSNYQNLPLCVEGGSISGTASVKVDHGTNLSTVTYPDAVADTGYEFSAWDVTEGTGTGDMIITASFTEKAPAEFFVFEEDADTTYVVKSTVTTNLYFKQAHSPPLR